MIPTEGPRCNRMLPTHDSTTTTRLLGLPGFKVLAAGEVSGEH